MVDVTEYELGSPEGAFWTNRHSILDAASKFFLTRVSFEAMHSMKPNQRPKTAIHQDILDELKEAFVLFDSENKGLLDGRELKSAIRALGFDVKKDQIRKMMSDLGKEPSDSIKFEEFVICMKDRMQDKGTREEVMKIFALFDDEQTGKITFRNLKRVAMEIGESISDEDLREMIEEADRDGDGALNFEEFYRIMKRRNTDPLDCWDSSDDE